MAHRWFSTTGSTGETVGFLGLGNMGLPMAVNLKQTSVEDGTFDDVLAFDLNESAGKKAQQAGLRMANSIQDLARQSSTIVTMLPGDTAVNSVMETILREDDGDAEQPNRMVIDCSTVSPVTSKHWNEQWKSRGHSFFDAPVSGGVHGAKNASLTFMVGGMTGQNEDNLANQRVETILSHMGQRILPCGSPGAGAAVKLCNNLALAAQMAGICEALNLGEALGVDPVVLSEVMNTSTAKCWSSQINNPHPEVGKAMDAPPPSATEYQGGFGTRLMLKDLGLAVAAASDVHVALPLGNVTKELYQMADLRGHGNKDFGVLLQFLKGK